MHRGYVMESPREAQRLADKVDAHTWVRRHLARHVTAGMRVLDVGCGPATITAEVAQLVPDGAAVGLDASAARIAVARRTLGRCPNASAVRGDALDLPFNDASFDLVYCRFLLEYLPEETARGRRTRPRLPPGSTVLLQDLDGQLVGHYPAGRGASRARARAGTRAARDDGVRPVCRQQAAFPARRGRARRDSPGGRAVPPDRRCGRPEDRARWQVKLEIAAAALTGLGFEDADEVAERFVAYLDREDTTTISHLFTAWAQKQ